MHPASLDGTYRALANPSRREMLRRLSKERTLTVSELAAPLPIALNTVMKHLDVLADAGLVERLKTGRVVTVTLSPKPMAEAMAWLEKTEAFWSSRLDRLSALVTKQAREKP